MQSPTEMLNVLKEARELLSLKDNDFPWSSWGNADDAVREIDGYISAIASGSEPDGVVLSALFAPTGPIQEVSLSSGWAERFLDLAGRFDDAFRGI